MDPIRQDITVRFRYDVHFTRNVFAETNPLFRTVMTGGGDRDRAVDVLFVVDGAVARAHRDLLASIDRYCLTHADAIHLAGPVLIVPGGERVKNEPVHLAEIHGAINAAALCRHSYVVAIGGGAVLDVAGYAAATAHRGIRLVRIPTTVLSQDDSAVGVKNGVNAFGKKNYMGTFAPPFAVINDASFLETLSDRDWRAGLSEAVKAGLIRDASLFGFIEQHVDALCARDLPLMEEVIRRSAALHLQHIATGGDPFELGSSRPLDFGHWAAHKLEQLTRHRVRHGEAVAVGIALDATYSRLAGFLREHDWRRILGVLTALGLPVYAPELAAGAESGDDPRSVIDGLEEFREHLGGRLTVMMLRAIGEPFDVYEIDRSIMLDALRALETVEKEHHSRRADRPRNPREPVVTTGMSS